MFDFMNIFNNAASVFTWLALYEYYRETFIALIVLGIIGSITFSGSNSDEQRCLDAYELKTSVVDGALVRPDLPPECAAFDLEEDW